MSLIWRCRLWLLPLRKAVRRARQRKKHFNWMLPMLFSTNQSWRRWSSGPLACIWVGLKTTPSWRDFLLECALNQRWATKVCGGGCSFCPRTWRM